MFERPLLSHLGPHFSTEVQILLNKSMEHPTPHNLFSHPGHSLEYSYTNLIILMNCTSIINYEPNELLFVALGCISSSQPALKIYYGSNALFYVWLISRQKGQLTRSNLYYCYYLLLYYCYEIYLYFSRVSLLSSAVFS